MLPTLLELGPIVIHTYGFLVAVGFILGVRLTQRLGRARGVNPDQLADVCFWSLIIGLSGGRLLFVLTNWDYFSGDPLAIFRIWEGGLVFYGGAISAIIYCSVYFTVKKLNIWRSLDALMPGVVVAHLFGRLGCFSSGCCYGRPTESFLGVRFNSPVVEESLRGMRLHPTQLYEAFALGLILLVLLRLHRLKLFDGLVTLAYFMLYAVARFLVEYLRGDSERGYWVEGVLSTSQGIALIAFALAALILALRWRGLHKGSKKK